MMVVYGVPPTGEVIRECPALLVRLEIWDTPVTHRLSFSASSHLSELA